MSLLLHLIPWTFTREQNHQFLSLHQPPNTSSHSSSASSLPFSTSPLSTSRRRHANLLSFHLPCAIAQQSSPSSTIPFQETEPEKEPRTRLIAQNVPWSCSAEDIRILFEKHGTVINVELSMYNKERNRGLAFITMGSEEEALKAIAELDSYETEGRVIKVEYANSQTKKKKKKKKTFSAPTSSNYDVFVGNLSWKVKSKDLKEFFDSMGAKVVSAEVVYQAKPRRPAGYGFVSFSTMEEAKAAISSFQGKILVEKSIQLNLGRRKMKEETKVGSQSGESSTEGNADEL